MKFLNKIKFIILCISAINLTGCYVMKAAFEQSKILINRQKIKEIVTSNTEDPDIIRKLNLVSDIRDYAIQIGTTPKKSFTYYSKFDKDVVSWIVVASKKDSFTLKTWWFPIVGSVPYKGYFNKEEAINLSKELETEGFETSVRGATAYSTLGWFNDPILTPLLKKDDLNIIETVLHEIFHSTYWKKDQVEWNESAANFFAINAALDYTIKRNHALQEKAKMSCVNEIKIAKLVEKLYKDLEAVYNDSTITFNDKLTRKGSYFRNFRDELSKELPDVKILPRDNNADLMQLKLYLSSFSSMQQEFNKEDILRELGKKVGLECNGGSS